MKAASDKKTVIGVAWHDDPEETYFAVCRVLEEAGAEVAGLGQVYSVSRHGIIRL